MATKKKVAAKSYNTTKTQPVSVRIPHDLLDQIKAVIPKLVPAGVFLGEPGMADIVVGALRAYLPTLGAKCAESPEAPTPPAKKSKSRSGGDTSK
jgi:hypothetical protein